MRVLKFFLLSSIIAPLLTGCFGDVKKSVDAIVDAIDSAVYTLDQNSSEYQNILENLLVQIESIDKEVSATIRGDITALLERTPATVGKEFRCNIDFVSARVKQGLQCVLSNFMLRNLYTGNVPDPGCSTRKPTVCSIIPSSIEQEFDPSVLDIYGYDFDLGVTGQVENNDGEIFDVSKFMSTPSHYHLTLNLGNNGVPNIYQYDFLSILYNDSSIATASIIQGDVCTLINPGSRTINHPSANSDELKACYKMDSGGAVSQAIYKSMCQSATTGVQIDSLTELSIDYENNQLVAATQSKFNKRYANNNDTFTLYQAPSGTYISEVSVNLTDSLNFKDPDRAINYIERGNFGLINQYEVKLSDVMPWNSGYTKIKFNSFEVCVSPY